MQQSQSSPRLAVGVFDGLGALCAPISDLLDLGVSVEQLGIIATEPTLIAASCPSHVTSEDWSRIAQLMADAVPVACVTEGPRLLAGQRIPGHSAIAALLCPPERHIPFRLPHSDGRLAGLLRLGYPVLVIAPQSGAQQRHCIRALLRSSRFPVETHEFAPIR